MATLSPRIIRMICKYRVHTWRSDYGLTQKELFLLSYSVISAMENWVWKIINRTHQDEDLVADASADER